MRRSINPAPNPTDPRSYQTLNPLSCISVFLISSENKKCDHFGTFKAATHHIVQQLTQAGPLVTKQTCDWLPQPPNCSQMHFSSNTKPPSQSYLPSLASRTGIWSQHPGLSYPPLLLTTKSHLHKSRPSSNRVFAFPL